VEIEIEMTTELTDMPEILQKVTQVVNSAKEQGFTNKELEIESDDDHNNNDDQLVLFIYTI
jgi:hypothetical protein